MADVPNTWPLNGYAPGNYACVCLTCRKGFAGDKRAITCLECAVKQVKAALLSERERRTAQGVTVPDGWKLYAWASSKPYRLNHLMSAAQYSNALPKNRVDFDIPLYGPAAPSLSTSAGGGE